MYYILYHVSTQIYSVEDKTLSFRQILVAANSPYNWTAQIPINNKHFFFTQILEDRDTRSQNKVRRPSHKCIPKPILYFALGGCQ